ncbi:hypothetical protein DY000_02008084 [Brassica cretica]|uniref:Uncharacterized protein n=1 Tax=Brassica cretica TaxID=69181 RepID=A0ABQ7BZW4_BRACR|nr:hypothetical protein DY000_02008084 [Brassica cretica]
MAATKIIFHHMVLIFYSFKGFSDLEDFWARRLQDDFQEDQEDFQTWKSSRRIPGSLLTESSPMSLFHNRSECFDLGQTLEDLWEVFSEVF